MISRREREFKRHLGHALRMARLDKNMDQAVIAKACGVKQSSVSRTELGKCSKLYTVVQISKFLGVDFSKLISQAVIHSEGYSS